MPLIKASTVLVLSLRAPSTLSQMKLIPLGGDQEPLALRTVYSTGIISGPGLWIWGWKLVNFSLSETPTVGVKCALVT